MHATQFPLGVPAETIPKLLPHGDFFRFITNARVEHEPPRSTEEGHTYTVTSTVTIPPPIDFEQFVERVREGTVDAGLSAISLILGSHFPGQAVMPGVILAEMMGQVGSVLLRLNGCAILRDVKTSLDLPEDLSGYIGMFQGFEVSFSRPVAPGDVITIEFTLNTDHIQLGRRGIFSGVGEAVIRRNGKETTRISNLRFKAVPPQPAE